MFQNFAIKEPVQNLKIRIFFLLGKDGSSSSFIAIQLSTED